MYQTGADLIRVMYERACQESNDKRKSEAGKMLDYYNGCQLDYILEDIQKRFPDRKDIFPVGLNIVKKIIRNLAMVYLRDAVRSVSGSKQDAAILSEIETSAAMAVKMKLANQYSKLLGTVLAWPNWRNGHMELDILTPDILDVETDLSPEDLKAVQITRYDPTGDMQEMLFSLWTPETVTQMDANGRIKSEEKNPYGILPFVPIWGAPVTDIFWQRGARDLVMAQDEINRLLTSLGHIIDFQGFSIGCVKGVEIKKNDDKPKVGPGCMMFIPKEGDFKFAAPDAPVDQILATIDSLIKWAAITSGLPASAVSADTQEMSGISRLVANAELEEMRRDDIALFAQYERKLFDVYRIVWNVHNPGRQISNEAEFSINFADPRPYIDPRDQIRVWQELMSLGLYSPVDVMQEIDPDLSREQAIKRLLRVQSDNADYAQGYIKDPSLDQFGGLQKTKLSNSLAGLL